MLNIGKLAPGGEDYYLDTVASGVEDYYTGAGEADGYWLGSAAPALGLSGQVVPEALRAVLGAADPRSGERLPGAMSRRSVPGFDCTLRAPKSVSLLWGLSDPHIAAQVRDAHDAAVAAAVGYLEDVAGFTRRGHCGSERVPTTGFVAAAFRHRTSRAGDPLLHTHVVVANLGQATDDGKWRSLDGRSVYMHAKTAGYLYQAHLRAELTGRLGVEWGPVRNGCADLAGVPERVIAAFSQRRAEILAHMAARGESSPAAAQIATLATRRAKRRDVDAHALGATWVTKAAALGFGPDEVAGLLDRQPARPLEAATIAAIAEELAGPQGLTARASTFSHRDVVRAWCERLPEGAPAATIRELADAFVADPANGVVALDAPGRLSGDQVIRRRDGRLVTAAAAEARYTTRELLDIEQHALATATTPRPATAVADPEHVDAALAARLSLSAEQVAMVRRLTGSGSAVEVVVGKAGTGKTFALDAARHAWQASGTRVIGGALAARAAAGLHEGAGIPSTTIDGLLARLDRPLQAGGGLPSGCVVVIDEAGMVGTRTLARLLDHTRQAEGKLVLVGDPCQLPEIDAGGLFAALAERLPAIELTENRRQHHPWEREALNELRHGDVATAIRAYSRAGRITIGADADDTRQRLVADWWAARHSNPRQQGVMIAARLDDIDDLNTRARTYLTGAGALTGPAVTTSHGRTFQHGDDVLALRNDRCLGVLNGTRGTVTAVDPDTRTITITPDRGASTIDIPAAYLDAGHLTHGYAITAHKAQGQTVDRAWILATDDTYREWGYVALSRGRRTNRLYVTEGSAVEFNTRPTQRTPDPHERLADRLRRSRRKELATSHTVDR